MVSSPSGTVTFLFTDVEGSTVRWERDPDGMSSALRRHDVLLRSLIEAHGGVVFATGGDGFAAAFDDPLAALQAAMEAQRQLTLPVRMGLHTGTAEERDGNYFGPVLNRGARIMAAGHGGQVLLSDSTASLVHGRIDVIDLGEHHLVGVDAPVRVWQVGTRSFPTLRTSTVSPGNLPVTMNSFVGRDVEMGRVSNALGVDRLVTIVGAGGIGKTRLALEVCRCLNSDLQDGVWFIDLGRIASGDSVAAEVARSLSVQTTQDQSIVDRVIQHLVDKRVLLVFDNCEHVLDGASAVIERLLREASDVQVLATSREALMLDVEKVLPLGSLSAETDEASRNVDDAVALFVDRVAAAGLVVDPSGPDGVTAAEICRQLDCMPLAIELAAARARSLGVSGVLNHLGEQLRLLSGGRRTSVGRQRTLVATLDWSYVLLSDFEQRVFDQLGTSMTWFELGDAIGLCRADGVDDVQVIDAVSALVEKSMCVFDPSHDPPRYRLLETVKFYALDHLASTGAMVECRNRHARHFATVARRLSAELIGPHERDAGSAVERVMADFRSALTWAIDSEMGEAVDAVAALAELLLSRGVNEMSGWCFDLRDELPSSRAIQHAALAHALRSRGDATESRRLAAVVIELEGAPSPATLSALAHAAYFESEFDAAIDFGQEAYDLAELHENEFQRMFAPTSLAIMQAVSGRDGRAAADEGMTRTRRFGWPTGIAWALYAKGLAYGDLEPATSRSAYDDAIEAAVAAGNQLVEGMARRDRLSSFMTILPAHEVAREMIDVLNRLERVGGHSTAPVLELSESVVLLQRAGWNEDAAVVCGWLDGRTNRTAKNIDVHNKAVAAVAHATGNRWQRLQEQGRDMPLKTLLALVHAALDRVASAGSSG